MDSRLSPFLCFASGPPWSECNHEVCHHRIKSVKLWTVMKLPFLYLTYLSQTDKFNIEKVNQTLKTNTTCFHLWIFFRWAESVLYVSSCDADDFWDEKEWHDMYMWDPAALYFDLGSNNMTTSAFFVTFWGFLRVGFFLLWQSSQERWAKGGKLCLNSAPGVVSGPSYNELVAA